MKLLILTQKVDMNDDVLGFMHGWIAEFAKRCEKITVVCLEKGVFDLPPNVKVLSLGKENGRSKIKYLFNFYKYIWRERRNYDTVFVHMNKEYVVLGGLPWRALGKRIGLWHVHKKIDFKLKLAEMLSHIIFTASSDGFNLKSKKLKIIGHGIDMNKFYYGQRAKPGGDFKIIYVGRISRIKNQKLLIEAIKILDERGVKNIKVDLVGSPIYAEDNDYKNELVKQIENSRLENRARFIGSVPNKEMAVVYGQADLSINLCPTGGMDKAVLESMASGVPVIVFNKAFAPLLNESDNLILFDLSARELADKIYALLNTPKEKLSLIGQNLRKKIIDQYNLTSLVSKIVNGLENKYGK